MLDNTPNYGLSFLYSTSVYLYERYRHKQGVTAMQKTLYLATFDVGYTHILRVFYAADEAESRQKKSDLEREINAVCKSLEHYPKGFRLVISTIPGTVEVIEEVQPRTIEYKSSALLTGS
jgi:hypothetical protein